MRKHQVNPTQHLDVRAFETSELARGRSLAELLRSTQTNLALGLDPELAQREKFLRQSLRVRENFKVSLLAKQYTQEELKAVDSELMRLEAEYKQVTDTIMARYPSYAQVTKPLAWTLPQIQKQVVADDQTLLLEYSLGAQQSYLWVVSRTELSSYELPGQAEIETEARRFYDLLTASQPKPGISISLQQEQARQAEQQLPAVTATLSKLLLGPVADKLGTKRLLIVADGPLQFIPFQVLVLPDKTDQNTSSSKVTASQQRPLISDHEIINEPSASILALVLSESANRRPPDNAVAVLADPVFESDDPRITLAARPGAGSTGQDKQIEFHQALRDVNLSGDGHIPRLLASRDEADAIMSVTPWRSGFQAMDFEASRATVMKTDLSAYRVVHFATHGLLNNEHPELSGVVLSLFDRQGQPQDGFLRLHDIYNLKLPVGLVVLSACNTGLGKDVKGEGLIGLTRGFMYAGASSVIASLWKVDDEATAELMRLFYGYMLRDGLSPAAALRKAQVSMSQQKRWQAPYYWAGFVIQGQYLPSQTVSRFPFPRIALWLVFAAVVSAAGLYALRRRRKIIV
jgi:CHAT domain-containing protein